MSDPHYPDLMALVLDAVCVVSESGIFLAVTGACERIFGYAPEELVGRQMLDFAYEPDRIATLGAVGRLMKGSLQYDFENRYVRKDGRVVRIMWSARWYPDKKVRVAVARDVTHRKIHPHEGATGAEPSPSPAPSWQLFSSPPRLVPPGAPPIPLSHQDYTVLATLAANGKSVSRKEIIQALGKDYLEYDQRRLDTQMRRLRRKVEQACALRLPVTTLRGVGYRFYDPIEIRI
ncbi:MAG TPA: PAS domain S-box protein [Burkholderiaceae bacterium]|nr:PAS domain S-box protein [Burkholderiaceae bacterium]HUG59270.1 PAS domain S-box protein [Candidimonas sp.]